MYSVRSPTSFDPHHLQDPETDPSTQFTTPMSTTPGDGSLLSSHSIYNPYSNSSSPSHLGTSIELTSDTGGYSDFTELNGDDEFYGVNFDANGEEIDFATAILADAPVSSTEDRPIDSSFALSQIDSSLQSESAKAELNHTSPNHIITSNLESPRGTSTVFHNIGDEKLSEAIATSGSEDPLSNPLGHMANLRRTTDMSGSSHASGDTLNPSPSTHIGHSPRLTLTTWESMEQQEILADSDSQDHMVDEYSEITETGGVEIPRNYGPGFFQPESDSALQEDDDDDGIQRSGVAPNRRRSLSDIPISSLKDQEKEEQLEEKKREILEWQSQAEASASTDDEQPAVPYPTLAAPDTGARRRAHSTGVVEAQYSRTRILYEFEAAPQQSRDPEEGQGIEPVSDEMSIHENRLIEGQIYYNDRASGINENDIKLMKLSRVYNDAPVYAHVINTDDPKSTAQDAINKFNSTADTFSVLSRSATWGTRRRSEPSLADIESIKDGTLLKRLSFGKGKDKKPGILENLSRIARRKSDANKLKREREVRDRSESTSTIRKDGQGNLAPPRSPSGSRRRPASPRLDTSVGGPSVPGPAHSHKDSTSTAHPTSPKNTMGFVKRTIRRARSRSDINDDPSSSGLVGLWREHGGPPVAKLATSPPPEDEEFPQEDIKMEHSDLEAEDDDEEDFADEGDMGLHPEPTTPIIPNFAGFQAHVLRLNPSMEATYLIDRIAHQQVVRYKNLLQSRVKHSAATQNGNPCPAGPHCMAAGGSATLFDSKRKSRDDGTADLGLHIPGEGSDGDSNPEGQLGPESFPQGVPMPPAQSLPAEFECQLCFKVKKFNKPSDWTKHVHEDVQPFTCTYQSCREPKSFKRKADWVRHENERHRHLEWWTCQVDDCSHKCFRKDNFLQHLVREHKYPEPKAKSKAAVKKARGVDEAIWAMVRNCHHETTNRPQDEPCKFCGKTMTSWKKLTVHLAKHMEHISLPVLNIVKEQQVDANTIISPVEPLPVRQQPQIPMNREASGSSAQLSHTISPNAPSTAQFSPMYPNSAVSTMSNLFPESIYGHQAPYGMQNAMQPQHQPNLLYDNSTMQYTNPQSAGFSSLDHSPLLDQTGTFAPVNQLFTNMTPHQQQTYASYASSTHTLSPDHTPYATAPPQQIPSFVPSQHHQSLTPEGTTPFPPNMLSLGGGATGGDGGAGQFGFTALNMQTAQQQQQQQGQHGQQQSGPGYGVGPMQQQPSLQRHPSQSGMGNPYPPSSQGGYGGYHG